MFRKDIVIPSGAFALALCVFSTQAEPLKATQYGDFDRYVLALSWQTGFCQSMVERNRNEPDECRLQKETDNKVDFLTVHGLWPGLPKSIAARGVDAPDPEPAGSEGQPQMCRRRNRTVAVRCRKAKQRDAGRGR